MASEEDREPLGEFPRDCYPLRARLWPRSSTQEWVLQIEGVIGDTDFTYRFCEPISMAPEDAAALRSYAHCDELPELLRQRDEWEQAWDAVCCRLARAGMGDALAVLADHDPREQ